MKSVVMVIAVIFLAVLVVFHVSMDQEESISKKVSMPQVFQDSKIFNQLFDGDVYDSKYISDSKYLMSNGHMLSAWYLLDVDTLIYITDEEGADYIIGNKQVYCLDLSGRLIYHGNYSNPDSDYRSNQHYYFDDKYTYGQSLGGDTINNPDFYLTASSMGFPLSGEHYEYYQHEADSLITLLTLPSYSEAVQ